MTLAAGRLRFRVNVEEYEETQNTETGAITKEWVVALEDEPAAIEPLSVRDLLAAQAMHSEVNTRIVMRWHPEFHPKMRIVHRDAYGTKIYYPHGGFLPDREYGDEYVTAPCSLGLPKP